MDGPTNLTSPGLFFNNHWNLLLQGHLWVRRRDLHNMTTRWRVRDRDQ
jgi:hypothetical protein